MASLRVRIGELELDERTRELRGADGPIARQPKVLDVLLCLIRWRDRVVPREELQRAVWGATAVAPDSLTRALGEVRKALGGGGSEMVRTFTSRGVRFVGPVIDLDEVPAPAAPVTLTRDRGAPAGDLDVPPGDPDVLVDREAVLATLEAALGRAATTGGGLRIILGAPGTGKSALLAAVAHLARRAGVGVVRVDPEAALAPLLAQATTPTVLLLDGLGVAGEDPRRLVAALARSRVVMVITCCTSRRHAPDVRATLAAASAADPDAVHTLGPLASAALATLTAHVLGRAASTAGLATLAALTGGNPRFARRVLHLAHQAQHPLEALADVPASFVDHLRELVLDHAAVAGPTTRAVLEATAILDVPFTADVAAEIAEIAGDAAADALADAAAIGLVVEEPAGRWRFAQELVRCVLERALPPSRRSGLHARAAVALEHWLGTPASHLDRLARHYVAGARAGHAPRALELVQRAAQAALDHTAFGPAARWLALALDVEALLVPRDPARRRALGLELATVQSRDGQVEAAADAFAAAGSDVTCERRDSSAERAAFLLIAPALPQVIERFYALLFSRYPSVRPLFSRAPELQRRMFGETIAALVDHADDPAWLRGHLEALGRGHAAYGTTPEMYGWARACFLDALEEGLAPRRLPAEVRDTWARTFAAISEAMIDATDRASAEATALSSPRTPAGSSHRRSSDR